MIIIHEIFNFCPTLNESFTLTKLTICYLNVVNIQSICCFTSNCATVVNPPCDWRFSICQKVPCRESQIKGTLTSISRIDSISSSNWHCSFRNQPFNFHFNNLHSIQVLLWNCQLFTTASYNAIRFCPRQFFVLSNAAVKRRTITFFTYKHCVKIKNIINIFYTIYMPFWTNKMLSIFYFNYYHNIFAIIFLYILEF